jgi:outer membrane receptor protein involved in Fe transport
MKINYRHKTALAIAVVLSVGTVYAQSTTGRIFGSVESPTGKTVVIENNSGFSREVPVSSRGDYSLGELPLGTYKVTVREGGHDVDSRNNIDIVVGAGTEVSFTGAALSVVEVTGTRITAPAIDVKGIDTRTVITAEELEALPLARTAEAIALLAPGVVNTSGGFKGATGNSLVSFGGSGVSENAYYLNGFNTGDPFRNLGGLTLPYGAIEQQEVYAGGYSAQYGRSNGGVINQVGKRGTNDWKFGASVIWEPDFARADTSNYYYTTVPSSNPATGNLWRPNSQDKTNNEVYSAYVGGPVVKDRLFFFAAGEFQRTTGNRVNEVTATAPYVDYDYRDPRWYAKIDATIIDGQFLEFTGAHDYAYSYGNNYRYNYTTLTKGSYLGPDKDYKTGSQLYLAKYTGYFGDHLTATGLFGYEVYPNFNRSPAYDASLNVVTQQTPGAQNPAYTNGQQFIGNSQTVTTVAQADQRYIKRGWRGNLNWRISSHSVDVGIDDQNSYALDYGSVYSGPGNIAWTYYHTTTPAVPVSGAIHADGALGIPGPANFPNGAGGYYAVSTYSVGVFSYRSQQRAEYIEDKWQALDRVLVSIGLRNDQFENYDPNGNPVAKVTKPTLAPRFGVSWDVKGDSTLKVFGNVGRYYLGLPLGPGGLTTASTLTSTYYTYSGINSNGYPTGLTPMSLPGSDATVSANVRFGTPFDYRTATAAGLKAEGQDEFILGVQKAFGEGHAQWVAGVRGVFRNLRTAVDDYNDNTPQLEAAAAQQGFSIDFAHNVSGILINPGRTNSFNLLGTDGKYHQVTLTREQMGFPDLTRKYLAGEFTLEKPFDGIWYAKFSYVLSHSYGDTEGETRSDLLRTGQTGQAGESGNYSGQAAVSTTQSWDDPSLMYSFNGDQFNDHRHQLKAYGYYQLTREWGASLAASAISGSPRPVTGGFGNIAYDIANNIPVTAYGDPAGYGEAYHYYQGKPAPPGSFGRLPWVNQVDLGVTYKPSITDHKLVISLNVFNVFNSQAPTNVFYASELSPGTLSPTGVYTPGPLNPLFGTTGISQPPRYFRLTASYDY